MQSPASQPFPGWHDDALTLRATRPPADPPTRATFAAARQTPEPSRIGWAWSHAELLSRIGFIATLVFYAATLVYGVSLGGRWEEVRQFGLKTSNDIAVAAGLGVARVTVEGNKHLTREQVTEALGIRPEVSIFAFDTAAARERLMANRWVREARVMRLLPATLVVELEERSPFAIWRDEGKRVVIDAAGRLLAEVEPASFPTLPLVSGPGAAIPAKEIVDMLRGFPELAARVRDMERIAGRRWDLLLDTGLRAKLPATRTLGALGELNEIVSRNPAAFYEISEIDLRLDTQFTLRLKDSSEEGRRKFLSWFTKPRPNREAL